MLKADILRPSILRPDRKVLNVKTMKHEAVAPMPRHGCNFAVLEQKHLEAAPVGRASCAETRSHTFAAENLELAHHRYFNGVVHVHVENLRGTHDTNAPHRSELFAELKKVQL